MIYVIWQWLKETTPLNVSAPNALDIFQALAAKEAHLMQKLDLNRDTAYATTTSFPTMEAMAHIDASKSNLVT